MKTIKQIEAILKANYFDLEKSMCGQYRLMKNNSLVYEEPANEDLYDYECALQSFYDLLTCCEVYEVYLAHDWNGNMKGCHYLNDDISRCIDPEYFSRNETEAMVFLDKRKAQAIADEINNDLLEEGMDAKAIVCEFELLEDIDEEEA